MRFAVIFARCLLGGPFLVFGLNSFFHWMEPDPEGMPEAAMAFLGALDQSGYMLHLVGGTQALAGALILTGILLPLGLMLLAPVLVNIVAFHMYLDPRTGGMAFVAVLVVLFLFLCLAYASSFRGVLQPVARHQWSPRD